jgi:hypothetical protein
MSGYVLAADDPDLIRRFVRREPGVRALFERRLQGEGSPDRPHQAG